MQQIQITDTDKGYTLLNAIEAKQDIFQHVLSPKNGSSHGIVNHMCEKNV